MCLPGLCEAVGRCAAYKFLYAVVNIRRLSISTQLNSKCKGTNITLITNKTRLPFTRSCFVPLSSTLCVWYAHANSDSLFHFLFVTSSFPVFVYKCVHDCVRNSHRLLC